jgi:hypothetical protein
MSSKVCLEVHFAHLFKVYYLDDGTIFYKSTTIPKISCDFVRCEKRQNNLCPGPFDGDIYSCLSEHKKEIETLDLLYEL